jgi:hypothetical protein
MSECGTLRELPSTQLYRTKADSSGKLSRSTEPHSFRSHPTKSAHFGGNPHDRVRAVHADVSADAHTEVIQFTRIPVRFGELIFGAYFFRVSATASRTCSSVGSFPAALSRSISTAKSVGPTFLSLIVDAPWVLQCLNKLNGATNVAVVRLNRDLNF